MSNDLGKLQASRRKLRKSYAESLSALKLMGSLGGFWFFLYLCRLYADETPQTPFLSAASAHSLQAFSIFLFGGVAAVFTLGAIVAAFASLRVRPKLRRVENEIRVLEILDDREADSWGFVTLPAVHNATAHSDGFAVGRYEDAYCDPPPSRL